MILDPVYAVAQQNHLSFSDRTGVMTFNTVAHAGADTNIHNAISENGLLLASRSAVLGEAAPGYAGSAGAFSSSADSRTILCRTNGTPFDLLSVEFARAGDDGTSITMLGYRGPDIVVTQTTTILPAPAPRAFSAVLFPGFTNITEVQWTNAERAAVQCDNITAAFEPNAPLPQAGLKFTLLLATNAQGASAKYARIDAYGGVPRHGYAFETSTNLVQWQPALPDSFMRATLISPLYLLWIGPEDRNRCYRLRKL